jgi:thiamine biosynthesis lipoprotein
MFMNVLKASIRYHALSGGSFDITAGPLIRLWGFIGGRRKAPSDKEIAFARSLLGTEKLELDPVSSTARLPAKGMEVDLGGIAKGYAVDRAVEVLKSAGVVRAVVNAGGDLFVLGGASECPEGIHVGIRHPLAEGKLLGWTAVREGAVATSGSYENYFIKDGRVYSHIIDPGTGYPVEGVLSATVLASTAMEADALATAFFVMGPEKGVELAEKLPRVEAMIVYTRGGHKELASSITTGFRLNTSSPVSADCLP